jgi:predicted metal-binding protein
VQAIFELVSSYKNATEGFLERKERPNALQANILGRFPPLGSTSHLVSNIEMDNP